MSTAQAAPVTTIEITTAWAILHAALTSRRAVRARYHDRLRVLCPHALGWKNGRPKALVYQLAIIGDTPPHDPRGWRSLYVDEIHDAVPSDDDWETADNYTPHNSGIDTLVVVIR